MPFLGATEGTVSESQGKLIVTKRSILGNKGQSDQKTSMDLEEGQNAFSEYQGPQ